MSDCMFVDFVYLVWGRKIVITCPLYFNFLRSKWANIYENNFKALLIILYEEASKHKEKFREDILRTFSRRHIPCRVESEVYWEIPFISSNVYSSIWPFTQVKNWVRSWFSSEPSWHQIWFSLILKNLVYFYFSLLFEIIFLYKSNQHLTRI